MQNIKYNIKEFKNLNNANLLFLAKSYQELYMKMYGIDSYDAYLLVTKGNYLQNISNDKVKKYAYNHERFMNILENKLNCQVIFIYKGRKPIGFVRINVINNSIHILELIISSEEYLEEIVKYLENSYKDKEKIYVNIPLFNIKLLSLLYNIGYEESTEDIKKDMYILNKSLGVK